MLSIHAITSARQAVAYYVFPSHGRAKPEARSPR